MADKAETIANTGVLRAEIFRHHVRS